MRVLIDASLPLNPATGTFRYVAELVKALDHSDAGHEIKVLTAPDTAGPLRSVLGSTRYVELVSCAADGALRSRQSSTRRCVRDFRPDVFHSPGYFAPMCTGARTVVTVHDVNFLVRFADWARNGNALRSARLAGHVAKLMASAVAVVVPSHQTGRRLGRLLPPLARKTHVVPYAATPGHCKPCSFSERLPLLLSVGVIAPQKNLAAAIRAFAHALPSLPPNAEYRLVGRDDTGYWRQTLAPLVTELELDERVHFLGPVDDDELERQYHLARALVFVSRGEGYGLPAVEAQARGLPVIASTTAAIGETTGGMVALVDPDATSAIASSMARLTNDERYWTALSTAGALQAGRSWADVAAEHLAVYEAAGKR